MFSISGGHLIHFLHSVTVTVKLLRQINKRSLKDGTCNFKRMFSCVYGEFSSIVFSYPRSRLQGRVGSGGKGKLGYIPLV